MRLNQISPLFGTFSEAPSAVRGLVTGAARTQLRLAMQDKPGCVIVVVPSAPTKNLQFMGDTGDTARSFRPHHRAVCLSSLPSEEGRNGEKLQPTPWQGAKSVVQVGFGRNSDLQPFVDMIPTNFELACDISAVFKPFLEMEEQLGDRLLSYKSEKKI